MKYALKSIVEGDPSKEERTRYLTVGEMEERGPGFDIKLYIVPYDMQALVDERRPGSYRIVRQKTERERAANPEGYPDFYLGSMQTTKAGDKFLLHLNMFPDLTILAATIDDRRGGRSAPPPRPTQPRPDAAPDEGDGYDDDMIPF